MFFSTNKRAYSPYMAAFALLAILFPAFVTPASAQKIDRSTTIDVLEDRVRGGFDPADTKGENIDTETTCGGKRGLDGDNSNSSGTYGNVRTFTAGTPDMKVSAWEKQKTGGPWNTAYLGHYGNDNGVGVTDRGEGDGGNGTHRIDNSGRWNYVMVRFNQNVTVDGLGLASIETDSDISVWVGTVANAYNVSPTLDDALLASFGPVVENTANHTSGSRYADISNRSGNVLVVAARVSESTGSGQSNDKFKLHYVNVQCTSGGTAQITIIKRVETSDNQDRSTQAFGFTATGPGMQNFALTDNNVTGPDRHTKTVTSFGAGNAVTVTENLVPSWSLLDIDCVTTGGAVANVSFANRRVSITSASGSTATCTFVNGLGLPSAAKVSISGRATLANGRAVSGATLSLLDVETGEIRTARTTSFGYYTFDEVEVERFYVLTINHKQYSFAENTRHISLMDQITDMNFFQAF